MFLLLCLLLAQEPEEIQTIPGRAFPSSEAIRAPKTKPAFFVKPPMVASLEFQQGSGFAPRFQYESNRTSNVPVLMLGLKATAPLYQTLVSFGIAAPDRPGTMNMSLGARGATPIADPSAGASFLHLGVGFQLDASKDQYELFQSGGAHITGTDTSLLFIGFAEFGVGRYDRSFLRVGALTGVVASRDSIGLYLDKQGIASPLDTSTHEQGSFRGLRLSAAIRRWGISLEPMIVAYDVGDATHALPSDCITVAGRVSYVSEWGVGVFVANSRTLGLHTNVTSSLRSLNNSVTFGATYRLPRP